jgi:hypothetical protein
MTGKRTPSLENKGSKRLNRNCLNGIPAPPRKIHPTVAERNHRWEVSIGSRDATSVGLDAASTLYGRPDLLAWFKQKFTAANYSVVHVLKSLTYFEEAEEDPMPDVTEPLSWGEVKQFFSTETPRLL